MLPQAPLILIFGMPRSGTTWLGKLFDSHPDTRYCHEPDDYPKLEALPRYPLNPTADGYDSIVRAFVADLPRLNSAKVTAKTPLFTKSWRTGIRQQVFTAGVLAAKIGGKAHLDLPVLGARADRIKPPPALVWKSIESLGRFGLLMHSLPEARGVHLIRHPCGQIGSVLRGERQAEFQDSAPLSEYNDLFEKLLEAPQARCRGLTQGQLRRLTPEERLAWYWVLVNEKAVDDVGGLDRARLVRYEDVCRRPAEAIQELFQFTGLAWNAQTDAFVHRSTHVNSGSYFSVYKKPARSAQRWREELPRDMVERIMDVIEQSSLAELYLPDESRGAAAKES